MEPIEPKAMLAFWVEAANTQRELATRFRSEPDSLRTHLLLAQNLGGSVKALTMAGLVAWRSGIDLPVRCFREALEICDDAPAAMDRPNFPQPIWKVFDPALGRLISFLLNGQDHSNLNAISPQISDWNVKGLKQCFERFLNAGLLDAMSSGAQPPEWDTLVASLANHPRTALLRDSFINYMSIVIAASSGDEAEVVEGVHRAGGLFARRRTDPGFAAGMSTYGGSIDNERTVDLRLAAAVAAAERFLKHPLRGIDSIHLWRW